MAETKDEILNEMRRQTSLLETLEKQQRAISGHLKAIDTIIVIAASVFAGMLIFRHL